MFEYKALSSLEIFFSFCVSFPWPKKTNPIFYQISKMDNFKEATSFLGAQFLLNLFPAIKSVIHIAEVLCLAVNCIHNTTVLKQHLKAKYLSMLLFMFVLCVYCTALLTISSNHHHYRHFNTSVTFDMWNFNFYDLVLLKWYFDFGLMHAGYARYGESGFFYYD